MSKRINSNKHIAVLALFHLGAIDRAIDTEDLAMKVVELAPGRFRWKKYPEQIDLEAVRLAVKDLRHDSVPLVTGSMRNGWMLTPNGVTWCMDASGMRQDEISDQRKEAIAALLASEACVKYHRGESAAISVHDIRRFLRIDEYTSPRRRKERVQAALNAASGNPQLSALIEFLQTSFPEEMA